MVDIKLMGPPRHGIISLVGHHANYIRYLVDIEPNMRFLAPTDQINVADGDRVKCTILDFENTSTLNRKPKINVGADVWVDMAIGSPYQNPFNRLLGKFLSSGVPKQYHLYGTFIPIDWNNLRIGDYNKATILIDEVMISHKVPWYQR